MYNAVETEVKNNPDNVKAKELLDKGIKGFSHANCFSGDTEFITSEGVKTFFETLNTSVKVLGIDGEWKDAKVKSFGNQEIVKLTLTNGKTQKVVKTTANHRWFKVVNNLVEITTTEDLATGDELQSMYEGSTNVISEWKVERVEFTEKVEEVYCVQVPDGNAFTLNSNLFTKNCSGICVKAGNTHFATLYAVWRDRYDYIEKLEKEINEKQIAKNGRRYTILSRLEPTGELDEKGKPIKKKVPYSLEEYRIEVLEGNINKEVELESDPISCECVF